MGSGNMVLGLCKLLLVGALLWAASTEQAQAQTKFKCSAANTTTCRALIDYKSPKATTLRDIQRLFDVKHLLGILGANNLQSRTPESQKVGADETVKIPFPCRCGNGTGLSDRLPLYTIRKDDGLDYIARTLFGGLVTYQQIQEANNISDPNLIIEGHKLWIPLPCSCDDVGGEAVVHYGHVVESGNSVEGIAQQYGTTQQILLTLNGISDPKALQAGQVLDVPLRACSSDVKNDSLDFPLLVANATDVYTANNCVKCKCDSAKNWILQCEPSQLKPTNWSTCPSVQCDGSSNSFLGNTTSTDSCNRTTCAYTGYSSNNISAAPITHNSCPAPGGSGGGSGASRSTLQGWVWNNLFIVFHFFLLFVYLL